MAAADGRAGSAAILILAAAVMELDVERAVGRANITTFSDALWWAVSTVATVGYGDHYPVTAAGRAIGVMLMVVGVGMFGVTAAAAAAWFVKTDQAEDKQQRADTITTLTAEVTALHRTVSELSSQLAARSRPPHHRLRPSKPSSLGMASRKTGPRKNFPTEPGDSAAAPFVAGKR